jgi:hypothetical protein
MLEVEHIGVISDEMREVVQSEWPELAHKHRRRSREAELKKAQGGPGLSRDDPKGVSCITLS